MARNVLISGAGVAGLAAAFWLDRAGFEVTLVERYDAFRRGGQAVDIRGVALQVTHAMGLLDDARAWRTRLKGMSMLDADGNEIDRTDERTYSAGRLDSDDIEIFRDDLCELLIKALSPNVECLNGNSIRTVTQREDSVSIAFESGSDRSFDILIGADGIYSNVRKHVFNDEAAVVFPLGVVLALFSTPNFTGLDDWQIGHRVEEFGYVIYPSRDKRELRIGVGFGAPEPPLSRNDVDAQKRVVSQSCVHLKGDFPKLLDAMRSTDQFYYNELAQIHMPSWWKGRTVLLGDAAHCASPFSGQGTSMALVGAFVLAHELVRHAQDFPEAFAAYENRMRPYVDLNQALVDLERQGPVPDEQLDAAKEGIDLTSLLAEPIASRER